MTSIFLSIGFCIAALVAIASLVAELRRDLTMLQQNSYRPERYMRWLKASGDTSSVVRLVSLAIFFFGLAMSLSTVNATMTLVLIITAVTFSKNVTRHYKKPLVMTKRAWRIFSVQLVLCVIVCAAMLFAFSSTSDFKQMMFVLSLTLLAEYCASHIITLAAVYILTPVENRINQRYYNDALRRLKAMPDLRIIGITGSYGKTSTKHFLYRILSEHFDTLMTPGSFNTTMGVIRTVREYLKPYNEVFIVEMGAKQTGDIKEICDLVNPEIGIVTAVGPQHLESFKTIDNVCATKFELVDALPSDGLAVINDDFEPSARRKVDNVKAQRYAIKNTENADYKVTDIKYTPSGTEFTLLSPEGMATVFTTPLLGEGNISNLAASIVVARSLGVPEDKIRYAVSRMEQVEHRLSVKHTAGGVTILDDAFNSNPSGSAMALDVLSRMTGGRRIIVTPGMVELGEQQFELNRKFGEQIAKSADFVIVVNAYNREAICAGLADGGMDEKAIRTVDTFTQAQEILATYLQRGDTVLYENDLPDTFK